MKIEVVPPDVNTSDVDFTVDEPTSFRLQAEIFAFPLSGSAECYLLGGEYSLAESVFSDVEDPLLIDLAGVFQPGVTYKLGARSEVNGSYSMALTLVPEPTSALLAASMGFALASLSARKRRH